MDVLTHIGVAIIGFIMLLSVLFLAGLKTGVPLKDKEKGSCNVEYELWKPDVPEQIKRHYELVYGHQGMPKIKSAVIQGEAKYKISNLWMPVQFQTSVEHGIGFLRDLEFYWYRKVIMKGIDFWIKGIGALRVNGVVQMSEVGENVTESQWISYWAESLLTGTFDFFDERLAWEVTEKNKVVLRLPPCCDGNIEGNKPTLQVHMNASTGRIHRIQGERYRGQLGKERIKWRLTVRKWQKVDDVWLPTYDAQWLDQKKPWCRYKVEHVRIMKEVDWHVRNALQSLQIDKYRIINAPSRKMNHKKRTEKTIE